eukprot:768070-Hanusia_phi.AAC.3
MVISSVHGRYSATYPVNTAQPFSHFRILQTGANASGNHRLCLGGIELYGVLVLGHERSV